MVNGGEDVGGSEGAIDRVLAVGAGGADDLAPAETAGGFAAVIQAPRRGGGYSLEAARLWFAGSKNANPRATGYPLVPAARSVTVFQARIASRTALTSCTRR